MTSSEKFLQALRLGVSLLCSVMNGMDLSFNVYAVPLKETFNFTQTQVEVEASMTTSGFGLAFIETFLTGMFGYTTTFAVTWIGLPLSSGLIAVAAAHNDFFHDWPAPLYVVQLCFYIGNGIVYMAVTRLCLEIVPSRHTGTFIGLYGTGLCFGKIVFAAMFELFFPNDVGGFFLCLSVMYAIILGLCYTLFYPIAMTIKRKPHTDSAEMALIDPKDKSFGDILRSASFHMTFWTTAVFAAAAFTVLHNITSITDSLGMKDPFVTVTTMSVCIMATRFLYGVIFDKVGSQKCAFILLFTVFVSFGTGLLIGMYFLNSVTIHILTVLTGIGIGPALYLPLTMLMVQFGRHNYSCISTSLFAIMAFWQFVLQLLMGFLYDIKTTQIGMKDNFCYGAECFFWSYVALLTITVAACVIQAINFFLTVYYPSVHIDGSR